MKQLKFDEDGFLKPQKISYEIRHEEETEDLIKNSELEKELLHGLKVLGIEDRIIRSLTIWCNSKYKRGSDQEISKLIMAILEKLIDHGIVIKETSTNNREIYSLVDKKNFQKK